MGYIDLVRMLVEAGANISAQDDNGDTVLHIAVRRDHFRGNTAVESLIVADLEGLCAAGVDKSLKNADGRTAADLDFERRFSILHQ